MKKTEKIFGLSETEYEIMEFMWQSDHKLTYKEILDYFNTEKNKNWKKQTLSTFLTILKYAGHITAEGSGRRYLYSPVKTREQHVALWTQKLCREEFGGSITNIVSAFSGGERLSDKDLQELQAFLDQFK